MATTESLPGPTEHASAPLHHDPEETIADYRIAFRSRQVSLLGQREVMNGRAKFGAFGDGKEVPQVAKARSFREGDWRAGYYRDQTFMFSTGMATCRQFFAQLYADADVVREPASGGRMMGNHFATRLLDDSGDWLKDATGGKSLADVSAVAAQMAWMLGLAYASKLFRIDPSLSEYGFSSEGDEVVFGSIGNAATSEGLFFEAVNAAGVLQIPLVLSVWDDGYGISVPTELQTIKSSISEALGGFQKQPGTNGIQIQTVPGWDYPALRAAYERATQLARRHHVPSLVHVTDLTQPQGHSTSGSHERYKSKERLEWEREHDCLTRMRQWMVGTGIVDDADLHGMEEEEIRLARDERDAARQATLAPIREEQLEAIALLESLAQDTPSEELAEIVAELRSPVELNRKVVAASLVRASLTLRDRQPERRSGLTEYVSDYLARCRELYTSHVYSQSARSPLLVPEVKPEYDEDPEMVDGRLILVRSFDENFSAFPNLVALGEDVGKLGDVNLVFEGLQDKYGEWRVTDTGIREATILGQGMGLAARGLRPIVDIQYLDYFLWALQPASDGLASLHHRTAGGQKAPVIIRTKGHRLQGMWHAGSPMGVILHSCRGIYLCVPRDMTRAAGMYNTLLRGDNPGIVIEVLNGYRTKEPAPTNIGTFTVALGRPDILREGTDITLVTYGALCRIALEASMDLSELGIDVEVIDVQTLNPFDVSHSIGESLKKTNAILFVDEDVPGGASAFMLQQVLEVQEGWGYLDAPPRTLTAAESRPPYATDGDYFVKPSREDIVRTAYDIMRERQPNDFPQAW